MAQSALTLTNESLLGQPITLTNCDREPIRIPGLIQPYGFLLRLKRQSRQLPAELLSTKKFFILG